MRFSEDKVKLMGTTIYIKIFAEDSDYLLKNTINLLHKYNKKFSIYLDDSEILKIKENAGIKPVKVDEDLLELIKIGKLHSYNSNLNIAIAPLVKLWNIGFDNARVPSELEILEALELTNIEDVKINNNEIYLSKKGMELDLGAIAKGYIADKIIDYLISKGAKSAYINLGGNVLTYGLNYDSPDLNWRIGLQNPNSIRGDHLLILAINDLSIVTSGDYERRFNQNGIDYHHIFDRNTGYPILTEMKSVSVISKKSVDCDIWTSKLFGMDINKALEIVNENSHLEAIIIDKNNKLHFSDGIEKYILWRKEYWKK